MSNRLLFTFVILFSFFLHAHATLTWGDAQGGTEPRRKVVLLNFGEAVEIVTVFAGVEMNPVVEADSDLVEISEPTVSNVGDRHKNLTYEFTFSSDVGIVPYSISVPGHTTLRGTFIVAGFVIKNDGLIVSGDARPGVEVGQDGTTTYDVSALGTDGQSVDLSDTVITPGRMDGGIYLEEVDKSRTRFSDGKFILVINPLRVGTGSFAINFEAPSISHAGETFENVLRVKQETSTEPPCVVMGSKLVSRNGVVEAKMYNLLVPPRASPVKDISLSIGGRIISFDPSKSSLVLPTSTVVFTTVSGEGPAEITCDGETAVVVENGEIVEEGLTVEVGEPETLAKDTLVKPVPTSDTEDVISSMIRVVDSDPETLTTTTGQVILDEYCSTVSATGTCVVTNITEGSAIMGFGAIVEDFSESEGAIADKFSSCAFQTATGFLCDKLELLSTEPANALAGAAAAGGVATWTIVLVSCIGALALIAVITLGTWAAHRRAALSSESSYSSSGPLGVPDPSDMLYEQTIVRDVYGRGPEGGFTQAEADTSERMAAMREEFPKPPSSGSSLSRRASEDASSTYSV